MLFATTLEDSVARKVPEGIKMEPSTNWGPCSGGLVIRIIVISKVGAPTMEPSHVHSACIL